MQPVILNKYQKMVIDDILWWFFREPEVSKSVHFLADSFEAIRIVTVVQFSDFDVNPVKKSADQGIVIILHALHVQYGTKNLESNEALQFYMQDKCFMSKKVFGPFIYPAIICDDRSSQIIVVEMNEPKTGLRK